MSKIYKYDDERTKPMAKLKTNRNIWKLLILSILTLGLYQLAFFIPISMDLNRIASRHDNERTPNYIIAHFIGYLTLSIVVLFWHHGVAKRIENELSRRSIDYNFGIGTFWGWCFFGSLILVGPWIYLAKLCKAMNLLCQDFNEKEEKGLN